MSRMVTPRSFVLNVSDTVLDDLRVRLERARWPDEAPDGAPWQYGTDLRYLRDLVTYWQQTFDWRAQEARLNTFKQYTAPVAGIDLHFIHEPGIGPRPLPLVLSHGWPGSVWEFYKLIPMLTDPGRFGGDPADAFTIVAPSLPGYPLSFQPGQARFSQVAIADAFATLMRDVLGYARFAAQGGDWGSFISAALGLNYPESVVGVHLNLLPLRRDPPPGSASDPGPEEPEMAGFRAELDHWLREETGYSAIQGTKPQTLAYGLTDSPVGLAGWILEKFRTWSDCDGDVERCFTKDELLTNIMLYWTTGAIGSSFYPYYARQHAGWPLPGDRRVEVPTAYMSFPKDILHPPRSMAERAFNIQRWTIAPRGGHFAALEEPELLARDIREFFRPLRT
jgi:pimeloyl-ACP methyl ester carboxylesterase